MSIPVAIADLVAKTGEFGWAYLLTVGDDQRPRIVAVAPSWGDQILAMQVGHRTAQNVSARPAVSICYPPIEDGGYSLIVDGQASLVGELDVHFAPSKAVLHRPAPVGFEEPAAGCGSDCVPVSPSGS